MAPQRIQRTREKGWKAPAGAVYVGRPTKWGNPIPASEPFTAEDPVRMFRELWDAEVTEDSPHDPQNARIRVDG